MRSPMLWNGEARSRRRKKAVRALVVAATMTCVVAGLLAAPGLAQTPTPDQSPTAEPEPTVGTATPEPQPSPAGTSDLALAATGPSSAPSVGRDFDLTFTARNRGPDAAPETQLFLYFAEDLAYRAALSSDPSDQCVYDDGTSPSPGGEPEPGGTSYPYRAPGVTCALGTTASGAATTITLKLNRTNAREAFVSGSLSSPNEDLNYENNYRDVSIPADTSKPADVGVKLDSPASPKVNSDFDYVLTVTNEGPSRAESIRLTDSFAQGLEFKKASSNDPTDTCTFKDFSEEGPRPMGPDTEPAYYGYSELRCELGSLASGESAVVTVTATRTSPWELYQSAWVMTANYDANYENDYAYQTLAADPSVTSDMKVTQTGPSTTPLVGSNFDIVFEVTNTGPAQANDSSLSTYLPGGFELVSAVPSDPADECSTESSPPPTVQDGSAPPESPESAPIYYGYGGINCFFGSLAQGESARATITMKRTKARESWLTSWVSSSSFDPNFDNNFAETQLEADKSNPTDVVVTKTAPANPGVGSDFDYVVTVTNRGPSAANDAMVMDFLPDGVDFRSVSSGDPTDECVVNEFGYAEPQTAESPRPEPSSYPYYAYREIRCNLGTLAYEESATITIAVTRVSEWEMWNTAWAEISNYDENFENDYASAVIKGKAFPDECPTGGEPPPEPKPAEGGVDGCDSSTDACGTSDSDRIVVGDCPAVSGAGADSIEVAAASRTKDIEVRSGTGGDEVQVNLLTGTDRVREIVVRAGKGNDHIQVTGAPGVGNARIVIFGGEGKDTLDLDVPAEVRGLTVVFRGGPGADTTRSFSSLSAQGSAEPFGYRALGGRGADSLLGGGGSDVLLGLAGRDFIQGGAGDDRIVGGDGSDVCRDGPGQDEVSRC
ncbi:MAG: hypothetical protein ABR505_11875 [Actinomycetota bacterium]